MKEGGVRIAKLSISSSRDLADRRRAAITLFELLLVLVLLVVIGSLATPLFEGSFSSVRLRRGTDQILAAWSEARTHAIESGQIYQFRFEPEGRDYRVDPWESDLEPDSPIIDDVALDEVAIDERTDEEIEFAKWKSKAKLPKKIVFRSGESVFEDELNDRQLAQLDQDRLTEWSTPILFYPDGTTSEASVLLQNNKGLCCRATLRSLTGVGRASSLLTSDEVNRLKPR